MEISNVDEGGFDEGNEGVEFSFNDSWQKNAVSVVAWNDSEMTK